MFITTFFQELRNEHAHVILVIITSASREGYGKPAQMCRLASASGTSDVDYVDESSDQNLDLYRC